MKKLLVLSLPFENGLNAWLNGERPTGTASIFYLAEKCAEEGAHVYWLMLDWTGPLPFGKSIHARGTVTVECVIKPSRALTKYLNNTDSMILHRFLKIFDFFPLLKRILPVAKRFQPEVIYSVGIYGILGFLVAKRMGVPSVHRMLGVFLTPYLHCWWRPIRTWNEILTLMFKPDLLIITNDGTGGDKVAEYFSIPKEKFWFPINGVNKNGSGKLTDSNEICKKYGIPPEVPVVISIGRLVGWKRMDLLIESFSAVATKLRPEPYLLILGEGPDRKQLENLIKSEQLNDHVKLAGNVSKKDLYALLSVANIAVFVYEYSNVGSALLEAIQAGKPVVTLANGDTEQFVIDGETGLLLNENPTPQELGEVIKHVLSDKELESHLGKAATKWAEKNLKTWDERMNDEFDQLERISSSTKQ